MAGTPDGGFFGRRRDLTGAAFGVAALMNRFLNAGAIVAFPSISATGTRKLGDEPPGPRARYSPVEDHEPREEEVEYGLYPTQFWVVSYKKCHLLPQDVLS